MPHDEDSVEIASKMTTTGAQIGPLARNWEESQSDRLARKAKEAPFMPIGILGLIAACGYGAYSYKHRGNMSTSVFLMQLRVTAQGAVVVCLTAGITYSLIRDFLLPKINSKNE